MESKKNWIFSIIRNIINSGMGKNRDIEKMHKVMLLNFISITATVFLIPLGIVAYFQGDLGLGIFDHIAVSVLILNCLYLRRSKNFSLASIIGIGITIILYCYLLATGGVNNTAQLWYYTFPLAASFLLGAKKGAIATMILLVFAVLFFSLDYDSPYITHYSKDFIIRFIPSFIVVFVFSYGFEYFRETTSAKLVSKNDELNRTIRELKEIDAKLRETQEQLIQSAKLASIGELAAGVAHELNQPLMVIRTTSQLLIRNIPRKQSTPDELTQQLEPIDRNTKRMMNIIDHLRSFSRQSHKEFSPVDVNQIIKECLLMLGEQLRLRNIEVKLAFASDIPQIHGNSNQLEQVFLNLITNARDTILDKGRKDVVEGGETVYPGVLKILTRYSNGGSSSVSESYDANLNVSAFPLNSQKTTYVEIFVSDNGVGIPREKRDKLYDPFFTTKEVGKGTGLGLSISHGIIKDHGGEIEVSETGPEGTTFRIRLPIPKSGGKQKMMVTSGK